MTPAQTRAHGLVTPSLSQLWLTAMLRVAVELVRNVASTLWMNRRRPPAECHSDATPAPLPGETTDTQQQEPTPAATSSNSHSALMVSSDPSRSDGTRPSNHEGALTGANHKLPQRGDHKLTVPLIPTKVGIQDRTHGLLRLEAAIPCKAPNRSWIPAFAGMSGDGVMMREGVRPTS
jgi:hypothetical protein